MNKKAKNKKQGFSTKEVVFLIIITCIVSLIMGSLLFKNEKKVLKKSDDEIKEFTDTYKYIIDNYYEEIDSKKLIKSAINGMLSSLDDDYSYLIDETDSDNFNIQLDGEYKGIGVEVVSLENGDIIVYKVFENSPADKAGLEPGDIIKEIDEKSFEGKQANDISKYIQNSIKNSYKIKIKRGNDTKELEIKKDSVTIKSVVSKTYEENNKKIGYIYIEIFSNVAYKQFKEELKKLEESKIDSLIIDVRDNTGGHLTTATKIMSLFLDSKHIIYQTQTKDKTEKFYSTGKITKKYPIVILQNKNSASASEMLSATLKEEYGAKVIGENSYGKGTVQEVVDLKNGSEYKITTKKWLTPKGNWINKVGVKPDYEIEQSDKFNKNPTQENDSQLKKALEELSK